MGTSAIKENKKVRVRLHRGARGRYDATLNMKATVADNDDEVL